MRLFLVLLIFVIQSSYSQTLRVHLFDGKSNESAPFVNVQLFDFTDSNLIFGKVSDLEGNCIFENIRPGTYSLRTSDISYGKTHFENIEIGKDTVLRLDLRKACIYNRSLKDRRCPACRKKDLVIPIVYGLLISMKGEGVDFISGGCTIVPCQPHWHCKRDHLNF